MRHLTRLLLVGVVAATALGLPSAAQGLIWSTVAVDTAGSVGFYTSLAVQENGDLAVSYYDATNSDLKFAVCDLSASAYGNCIQPGDWSATTVDAEGAVGRYTSLAVNADANPMASYFDHSNQDLKFAMCDLSASANGNCDQSADWSTVTVDSRGSVGEYTAIAADTNGNPVISYHDTSNKNLKFAVCDLSLSASGNCDQSADWRTVTVDSQGSGGRFTSIAIGAQGDPVISYHSDSGDDLRLATCDISASANGNCDQTDDWSTVTVDSTGSVGDYTSIAVDPNGDLFVSYQDLTNTALKFAACDVSASANGNCDQTDDWSTVTVDSDGSVGVYSSIAVATSGDPMISHHDATNTALKFATCDLSASTNANCDQTGDWGGETVDSTGWVGRLSSVAVNAGGNPVITYADDTNGDLRFASTSPGDADGDGYPDDVDGCPTTPTPWPTPFGDSDCDGFTDAGEASVGTDPADPCAHTPDAHDEADDRWPADFDDDQTVDILDIVQLTPPAFNTSPPNPNYSVRKDIAPDGAINILDIVHLTPPVFNTRCTP